MTQARDGRGQAGLLALIVWPAIAVLIGLGTWQAQRLVWKTELIERMQARLSAPAKALPSDITASSINELEFTRVLATGVFRHESEMIVLARTRKGEAGSRVVTPFVTEAGRSVLVDRGWVPIGAEDPAGRAQGQIVGTTTVEGLLRGRPQTNPFTPDNQSAENVWYWIEPEAMSVHAGFEPQTFYVEAGPAANPGGLPVGGRPVAEIANNHLQYAITWYGLAAGLLGVYVFYRRAERRRSAEL